MGVFPISLHAALRSLGMRVALSALFASILASPWAASAADGQRLYPGAAPGSEDWTFPESARDIPGGKLYTNVRDPELTAHLPDPTKANGAAVILLPGGALRVLAVGREAEDMIHRFTARGIAVFVLKYRTLQLASDSPGGGAMGGMPEGGAFKLPKLEIRNANANPSPNDAGLNTVLSLAIGDAQVALRQVRANAAQWKIDPERVGFIGSSAGGGVAIGTILTQDPEAVPNFVGSLYGPSLMDVVVPQNAPPLFMATEADHGPVTDGLLALFSMWKTAGKRAELHVFEVPNFRMSVSLWADRFLQWMTEQKLIPPLAPAE